MRIPRLALAGAALLAAVPAGAIDRFEIQVYEPELNEPGHAGVELHSNYTVRGSRTPAFPGESPPDRAARFTLEPAYGVTSWLELGAYLQSVVTPSEGARFAGGKVRAKLVAPRFAGENFFVGVNVEVGRVPSFVDEAGWANEIRPLLGWADDRFLFDLNPIVGYALTGKDRFRVDFEPAAKVSVNSGLGFAVGAEWYAELGFVDAIRPLRDQAHYLFGVLDLAPAKGRPTSRWEVNLALGGGFGGGADQQFIAKTIVGRSF